jgi:hypothetical protein
VGCVRSTLQESLKRARLGRVRWPRIQTLTRRNSGAVVLGKVVCTVQSRTSRRACEISHASTWCTVLVSQTCGTRFRKYNRRESGRAGQRRRCLELGVADYARSRRRVSVNGDNLSFNRRVSARLLKACAASTPLFVDRHCSNRWTFSSTGEKPTASSVYRNSEERRQATRVREDVDATQVQ